MAELLSVLTVLALEVVGLLFATTLPHPPCFWPGEDILVYILYNIRRINKEVNSRDSNNIPQKFANTNNLSAQKKRCYDVTLSRQEGNMMRHLASAQY